MLTAFFTIGLTFLLTSLTAPRLVQAWQHLNWKKQQQLLDAQNEYNALRSLLDEFASLSEKRRFRMLRLLWILDRNEVDEIKIRLNEYDESLKAWNDRFTPLQAKLTVYVAWSFAARLQDDINLAFVTSGQKLERMTSRRLNGDSLVASEVSELNRSLNHLEYQLFRFNRDLLKKIKDKKDSAYEPPHFTLATLHDLPTWELFKALFKPWV
jgi:hypothetical protein